jgi:UDP-N-acetylglucosamine/UDP-N-acetylgalactosamine diphosphorylase
VKRTNPFRGRHNGAFHAPYKILKEPPELSRTLSEPEPSLVARLARHGQEHLLRWWAELDEEGRARLAAEIETIDFDQLDGLIRHLVQGEAPTAPDPARVEPVAVDRLPRTDAERVARRHTAERGEAMLAAGEVAVVVVAGGQGTRLGFDGPKGTFPIGPVSGASLFQIHAEKIVALGRRYGRALPLYVMTSPENHEATARFFAANGQFGLEHVRPFVQGQMPAVAQHSGRVLLAERGKIALSPDGHGGTLAALNAPGPGGTPSCLDEMRTRGIRTLFYFQVDNPLVRIAEEGFLGLHRQAEADVSFKVIEKLAPDEKVGVVVTVEGRPQVIEYSDLPAELAERREPDGGLQLWAGSIAIHLFELEFVERIVTGGAVLPFHTAMKRVRHVDDEGRAVNPAEPNAVKFERFIFDALPLARRWAIAETDRTVEFEPLKNATGPDSPETVRRRMGDLFAGWLEGAGARVERGGDGSVPFGIEISPLYALDAAELRAKLPPGLVVEGPLYLR